MIKCLSPSLKFFMSLVFMFFVALAENHTSFVFCATAVLLSLFISGAEAKNIIKTFKPIWAFVVFLTIITMLASGISKGLILAVKITLITASVSVLINTTREAELQKGIITLLSPLKKIRIPVGDIAFVITLVLRFIPRITDEWHNLSLAREARGIILRELSLKNRIKVFLEALGTLILNSMKNAEATAISADARCFGLGNFIPRTKEGFSGKDITVFILFIIFCIFLGLLEFLH